MDQRREKEGVVIPSHLYIWHAHLYTTHPLKLGMDQKREKEGVVIPSHLYVWHAHLHNSQTKVRNGSEKRKRGRTHYFLFVQFYFAGLKPFIDNL